MRAQKLDPLYEEAIRDIAHQFEATGSPWLQCKYHNFLDVFGPRIAEHGTRWF